MKEIFKGINKVATLTNFLIITIVCILIYFIFQLVKKCNYQDPIKEGFVAQKELTDLLDKLRVKLYEKESVWNNELFNQQPDRKENITSFWEPKNDTGQPFKRIGQCISIDENYDMPSNNTMLIDGDVKPPKDSTFLFQFPGNIISINEKNSKSYNVFTGIRNIKDIDERLSELNTTYQKLVNHRDNQKQQLNNIADEINNQLFIKLYKKNEFFNDTPTFTVMNNNNLTIPNGQYSSISIPFGSKVVLNSENGTEPLVIDLPLSLILDANNQPKPLTTILYNEIISKVGLNGDDFNIFGKYGLGAVQHYGYGKTNDKDKSSEEMEFSQSTEDVYSPAIHSESLGTGFSRILVFTNVKRELNYSYNYTVSNNNEHSNYGRNNLFDFAVKLYNLTSKINPIQIYNYKKANGNYISFVDKPVYRLKYKTKEEIVANSPKPETFNDTTTTAACSHDTPGFIPIIPNTPDTDKPSISHPYITDNLNKKLVISISELNEFNKVIKSINNTHYWFNIPVDDVFDDNSCDDKNPTTTFYLEGNGIYYLNLAFMFTTMKKMIKRTGEFATDINSLGGSCCEIADITEESLSRRPNFQGYVTSGTVSLNIPDDQHPLINYYNTYKNKLLQPMNDSLLNVTQMINQLDNLKSDILENKFKHFPLKIYRPIPNKNYISLGDVLFNHRHINYNLRQPILDNIATIPKQCYKEVRDWLSVDKVYEYRDGDTYLSIFKNPYLQTFKAVTVPDTLPPGRVGKVVACVEGCSLLDDIIEADKCSKKFFKANKEIIEGVNLDPDNTITSRESTLYKNKIQDKQDRINTLKEVSRRLQIQDDKANIINHQYNKQQLQNLVDSQRLNINTLVDELEDGKNRIDVNVNFSYDKFQGLITILRDNNSLPPIVADRITEIVDKSAKQKLKVLSDKDVKEVLTSCPTPNTEGLVVKALVESGCYNCYNLK